MKSFKLHVGPRTLAVTGLALIALAVALPVFLKHPDTSPPPMSGITAPPAQTESAPAAPSEPKVFRFFQESPRTLDPGLASDAYSSTVIAQIYSPLVGLTSNLEPTPQVADSWTISRDGLVYVFHIREGVRFHNGRPVTAEDFAYTLNRVFTVCRSR
jgi:ABC-type transport system substrate-binding protein